MYLFINQRQNSNARASCYGTIGDPYALDNFCMVSWCIVTGERKEEEEDQCIVIIDSLVGWLVWFGWIVGWFGWLVD